jgi:hypothetical protein
MTISKVLAASMMATLVTGTIPALAGEPTSGFGRDGQVILSAERLFGLTFTKIATEDGATGDKQTLSRTNVALLWPSQSLTGLSSPYEIPRVAVDVVVASGITLGGSVGFISGTGTTKTEARGVTEERDAPRITVFAFSPRVGYALPLSDQFAFWPRAGVTYFSLSQESKSTGANPTTRTTTVHGLGVDLEAMFVYTPVPHFGITACPVVDLPLSGSSSSETLPSTGPNPPDDKVRFTNFGLTLGLLGYF